MDFEIDMPAKLRKPGKEVGRAHSAGEVSEIPHCALNSQYSILGFFGHSSRAAHLFADCGETVLPQVFGKEGRAMLLLEKIRKDLGLSLVELGELAGMHPASVEVIEKGLLHPNPTKRTQITKALEAAGWPGGKGLFKEVGE
jgi:DNA-binding XRE family transcriptional regulator